MRTCVPSFPVFSAPLRVPDWFVNCLGFNPLNATQQRSRGGTDAADFTFDSYQSDEFDHLLTADPSSGSFFSRRFPFARSPLRASRTADANGTAKARSLGSESGSLKSLFIDVNDAEVFGDESINMLLTSTGTRQEDDGDESDGHSEGELARHARKVHGQTSEELRVEEEELARRDDEEILLRRVRAEKLALERGLLKAKEKETAEKHRSYQPSRTEKKELAVLEVKSSRTDNGRASRSGPASSPRSEKSVYIPDVKVIGSLDDS